MYRLIRDMWKERVGYLFVLPSFILFALFFVYPVFSGVNLSFVKYNPWLGNTWVGFRNYVDVWQDSLFWISMRNTAVYALVVVAANLVISTALALLIFSLPINWQTVFKSLFYLPVVASGVIVALIWKWLYHPAFGLFNYILSLIGYEPVAWLGSPKTALGAIIFMTIAIGDGAAILLILASLGSIPRELYEAAAVDGAAGFSKLRRITLPLLKPIILYLGVMGLINALQVFVPVFAMTRGGPNYCTMTVAYKIYYNAFMEMNFGIAAAQGVILFAVTLVVSILQFQALGSDLTF